MVVSASLRLCGSLRWLDKANGHPPELEKVPSASAAQAAHEPPVLPRGTESWRVRGSSPGSGLFARLPDREVSGCVSDRAPVTVAGPHRHCTGFRVPRARQVVNANLRSNVLGIKRARDPLFEPRAFLLIRAARFLSRRRRSFE